MTDNSIGVEFPGVVAARSATFTMTRGVAPSVGTIEIFPQDEPIDETGTLRLTAGDQSIELEECRIQSASLVESEQGPLLSLSVLDRRWKWAFHQISGEYNLRDRKNDLIPEFRMDAVDLILRCLAALGVTNYDVSQVPTGFFPHVEWVHASAAQALQDLCEKTGCLVALKRDGQVVIEVVGQGAPIPAGGEINVMQGIDPPEGPDATRVICAPTRYQALIHLEPVGLELDGAIQPIDQLSYAPAPNANGIRWTATDPKFKASPNPARQAAATTVFRWYRIKVSVTDSEFMLPLPIIPSLQNTFLVRDIHEILPISSELVETFTHFGQEKKKRARVYGTFKNPQAGIPLNSNQQKTELGPGVMFINPVPGNAIKFPYQPGLAAFPGDAGDFRILEDFGIVEFPEPVTRIANTNEEIAADLWLMCSFHWRHWLRVGANRTGVELYAYARHLFQKDWRNPVVETDVVNLESELQAQVYADYNPDDLHPTASWNALRPFADIDQAAEYYADAAHQKFVTVDAAAASYCGLIDQEVDGAIQTVTWEVCPKGPTTRIQRNTTPHPATRPWRFARFLENLPQLRSDPRALLPIPSRP